MQRKICPNGCGREVHRTKSGRIVYFWTHHADRTGRPLYSAFPRLWTYCPMCGAELELTRPR